MISVLLLQIRFVHFRKFREEQNHHSREDSKRNHGVVFMYRIEPTKRHYLTLTEPIGCDSSDLSTRPGADVNFTDIYVN